MKGNLNENFDENEELVAKSEIVEKFIKVVENSENSYLNTTESQTRESTKPQRSNPFGGKSDSPNLNSREEIRKKLAFGGFGPEPTNSGENSSKKSGKPI